MHIEAYQVSEHINIKKFRSEFTAQPYSSTNVELFYIQENDRYIYLFNYGVVVFAGMDDLAKSEFLRFLKPYAKNWLDGDISDDLILVIDKDSTKPIFNNTSLVLPALNENVLRIVMLNTGQSVALDYYEELSFEILNITKPFTDQLELYGNVKVSKKNLLKFIGKALNVKNSIADNLYILDDPGLVWDDEYLELVNKGLKDVFDIYTRFRNLDYRLKIVEDNLRLYTDLLQTRTSHRLEWIIIILILLEFLNVLLQDFF